MIVDQAGQNFRATDIDPDANSHGAERNYPRFTKVPRLTPTDGQPSDVLSF